MQGTEKDNRTCPKTYRKVHTQSMCLPYIQVPTYCTGNVVQLKHSKKRTLNFLYSTLTTCNLLAGFHGDLDVSVTYTLTGACELRTEMEARPVNKATPVNLAQHSYFNLAGHGSGDVLQHRVQLWSTGYTPLDGTQIPIGEVVPVHGTPFDFTEEASIGSRIGEVPGGYDHNYDLRTDFSGDLSGQNGEDKDMAGLRLAAKVWDPSSKRAMEVFTTAPGVQFYSGNFLDGIVGKGGAVYNIHAGLCLETQGFPNAVNEPRFPSIIVRPGESYRHVMVHKFYTI